MAPMDAASSTMLEAYLGGSAFAQGPVAPPPRMHAVFSPRKERVMVNGPRSGKCSAVESLLSGRWIPPKAPKKVASEAQSCSSVLSQKLRRPPMPRRAGRGRSHLQGDAAFASKDSNCGASECSTEFSEGYKEQSDNCNGSVLSHATTPSWRSRSFPRNFKPAGAAPKAEASKDNGEPQQVPMTQRRRLPPLPSEARGPKGPTSEVRYLGCISSEVNEANAMLADSFIGAKRRPESDVSCEGSFGVGHGVGGRSQVELSAIPEGQSHCGSYEPGPHQAVCDNEDAHSRAYSYHLKSEVASSGEVHHHHYHVLHHYHKPKGSKG